MNVKVFSLIIVFLMTASVLFGCRRLEDKDTMDDTTEAMRSDEIPLIDDGDELSGELSITTPYVTLKYPEKWLNYLKVQKNFEEGSNVSFYACIEKKQNVKLFTVHFNEDGQIPLGVLETSDESVYISFSYAELEFDETWTQNEEDVVNAMQEQINYVIDALEKETGFVPEN